MVAHPLGELAQRPGVDGAVEAHAHHLGAPRLEHHLGPVDVVGEGPDAGDGLVDVLERLHPLGTAHEFDGDPAAPLTRRRGDLPDPGDAAHHLFDRAQDALLHLLRCRSRVTDVDLDGVELELGEDLLLDVEGRPHSADEEHCHQQIGSDRVADHPGDGAALIGAVVVRRVRHGPSAAECPGVPWAASAVSATSRMGRPSATVAKLVVTTRSPALSPWLM